MPVDEKGNRADLVLDPNATFSRMNLARLFETYVNTASRDLVQEFRQKLNLTGNERNLEYLLENSDYDLVESIWNRLMRYYQVITPRQHQFFVDGSYPHSKYFHLAEVLKNGIYLWIPTDNEPEYMSYIEIIEKEFTPTRGKVKWQNKDGSISVSEENVQIGSLYMLLLEKTGNEWAAVASGKVQQHGILAPLPTSAKHSAPARQQPPRASGEAEVRNFASYIDPITAAELLDRNSNPETHRLIVRKLLSAEQPTNIESVIDRKVHPLGYSKPLQIVKHTAYCAGYEFVYKNVETLSTNLKETK